MQTALRAGRVPASARRAPAIGALALALAALACTTNPGASRSTPSPVKAASDDGVAVGGSSGAEAPEPAEAPAPVTPEGVTPTAPPPPVEVVVRDLEGAPIAGAKVLDDHEGSIEARTHIADADGVVTVPAGASLSIEAPGALTLTGGRAPMVGRGELLLLPGSTIVGRVVDAGGRPVGGAAVRVASPWKSGGETTTDEDGRFRVDGLPPGQRLLTVRAPGVWADRLVALGLAETSTLSVKAARTATIEGRAFHEGGEPCSGGSVELFLGREGPSDGCPVCGGEDPTLEVAIADDGSIRAEVPSGLVYGVKIACSGAVKGLQAPIYLGDAGVSGLRWEVSRGLQIHGRVVDAEGRPRPRIEVDLRSLDERAHDDNGESVASTDDEGRFDLLGLEAGDYEVIFSREAPSGIPEYENTEHFTLEERDLDGIVFVVKPGVDEDAEEDDGRSSDSGEDDDPKVPVEFRGVVVDTRGRPVAGALLRVLVDARFRGMGEGLASRWTGEAPVRSGVDGTFVVPWALERRDAEALGRARVDGDEGERLDFSLSLVADLPGGAIGVAEVRSLDPVEVRVGPRATATVRLRDPRGRPITYYGVDVDSERPRPIYLHAPGGEVTVPGFAGGAHSLRLFSAEGGAGRRFTVSPGRPLPRFDVDVGGEVENVGVHVVDVAGGDAIGCRVELRPYVGPVLRAEVDDGGWANFNAVPSGLAEVRLRPCEVEARRYLAQARWLRIGGDSYEFERFPVAGHEQALGRPGELGYAVTPPPAGVDPLNHRLRVRSLRRGGPAERAGLRVGDEIVRVGAGPVSGRDAYLHEGLTRVARGGVVTLALADGRTVEITAE